MWPFGREKPPHELGDDPQQIFAALQGRRQWRDISNSCWELLRKNVAYVFNQPREAAEALRNTVMVTEQFRLLSHLAPETAPRRTDADRMSLLSLHLGEMAIKFATEIRTAETRERQTQLLFLADSSASASLVWDRYQLQSYLVIASLTLELGRNREQARLWCDRYRRAEHDLLSCPQSDLTTAQRSIRDLLDPTVLHRSQDEMRRHLPTGGPPNSDETLTARQWLYQIEANL